MDARLRGSPAACRRPGRIPLSAIGPCCCRQEHVRFRPHHSGRILKRQQLTSKILYCLNPYQPRYVLFGVRTGSLPRRKGRDLHEPGADLLHGALFFTDNDGSFNATDPFSLTATPAGKRRYGFELSGPIRKQTDYALALEKRNIDEFNVVNAISLNPTQTQTNIRQAVSAPQRLRIASARGDWQASPNDVATLSFTANVNTLRNQGVGGLVLPEAGYTSRLAEYDLRLSNLQTFGANLLHQTRIGYSWIRTQDQPNPTSPALQVAGFFSGGGSTSQALNARERDLEVDDSWTLTRGRHTYSRGAQSPEIFVHDFAPTHSMTVHLWWRRCSSPRFERRADRPDSHHQCPGTVPQSAAQPAGKHTHDLPTDSGECSCAVHTMAVGPLRERPHQVELPVFSDGGITLPGSNRAHQSWELLATARSGVEHRQESGLGIHLRAGLFHDPNPQSDATDVYRLDGVRQRQIAVYSPSFSNAFYAHPRHAGMARRCHLLLGRKTGTVSGWSM